MSGVVAVLFQRKRAVAGTALVAAGVYYYVQQLRQRQRARAALAKAASANGAAAASSTTGAAAATAGGADAAGALVAGVRSGRGAGATGDKRRVGVDAQFLRQLQKLLPICIPSLYSREFGLLCTLAVVLLGRTWLDIWFSAFNGEVVKAIVTRNKKAFIQKAVIEFGLMMWPMSVVNNMLKLCINSLAISFRARLTKHAHEQYLKSLTFYKVSNLDNRLVNADQLLTQDIDKFSENLSHLYSDLAKPIVDIVLFAVKLGQAIGTGGPFYMVGYFVLSGAILRAISPPFGKYTAQEQKLEGDFRFTHSRIITHAEEIAFYGGNEREKSLVNGAFDGIVKHVRRVYQMRFANGVFDSILVKYMATMTAYILLSRPVFEAPPQAAGMMGAVGADPTQIIEDYSRNSSYLVKLSQAVGALMMEARHLAQFAGYTSRVAELFDVLEDVNRGRYERTMVKNEQDRDRSAAGGKAATVNAVGPGDVKGRTVLQDHIIRFDHVPVVTPNGDMLVRSLTFEIRPGMNCLITGPNGCGKSSLFRILGGLWPLFDGVVTKPADANLFYVPQKPYLALGTLRDQVIYPDTRAQAIDKGVTDEALFELLRDVALEYLVAREGGWDSVADWADVLSGGEKQRIAMARLFYHRPQFAILDECTSAVSVDVEGRMYTTARKRNITLFTVSHRQSLWQYHEYLLKFDGLGGYEFRQLQKGENAMDFSSKAAIDDQTAALSKGELQERIDRRTREQATELASLRALLDAKS